MTAFIFYLNNILYLKRGHPKIKNTIQKYNSKIQFKNTIQKYKSKIQFKKKKVFIVVSRADKCVKIKRVKNNVIIRKLRPALTTSLDIHPRAVSSFQGDVDKNSLSDILFKGKEDVSIGF